MSHHDYDNTTLIGFSVNNLNVRSIAFARQENNYPILSLKMM